MSQTSSTDEASQWRNPSDILSLLLLIGGDVIQRAIAQLAGDEHLPTPVVFSFGWVAFTFTALLSAVGDNRLMPSAPDLQSIVISSKYGHARANQSWILGRILRDYEQHWMPSPVRQELEGMLEKANSPRAGLCVSVFEADPDRVAGRAYRDLLWTAGYVVTLVQLVFAAIPWIIWREWEIFAITAAGTVLAFVSASLPQWRMERWACRRQSSKTVCLTQGNGAQHVLVIKGAGRGLDLEDLAGSNGLAKPPVTTRPLLITLTVFWVALLITVSGIHDHTWFLIAIGGLGMVYTIFVAGAPRRPEAFGIPLKFVSVHVRRRVMDALQATELDHPGVGQCLLPTFFPGGQNEDEVRWWAKAKEERERGEAEKGERGNV